MGAVKKALSATNALPVQRQSLLSRMKVCRSHRSKWKGRRWRVMQIYRSRQRRSADDDWMAVRIGCGRDAGLCRGDTLVPQSCRPGECGSTEKYWVSV